MPSTFDLRDDYYEDFRQVYGDGDYAMDMAEDAARADHQRMLAAEEQQRDLLDLDNEIRFEDLSSDSNDSPNLPTSSGRNWWGAYERQSSLDWVKCCWGVGTCRGRDLLFV